MLRVCERPASPSGGWGGRNGRALGGGGGTACPRGRELYGRGPDGRSREEGPERDGGDPAKAHDFPRLRIGRKVGLEKVTQRLCRRHLCKAWAEVLARPPLK